MANDIAATFLATVASRMATNEDLIRLVASAVAHQVVPMATAAASQGGRAATKGAAKKPGRPAKAAKPAKAKGKPGRKPNAAAGSVADRVLAAVRGGASRRGDVMAKAGISANVYKTAIKALLDKGLVKIEGNRGGARLSAS